MTILSVLAWAASFPSPALARDIVLPSHCSSHPTPPPERYLHAAVHAQQEGTATVTVRVLPPGEVHFACGGGASPVGYPGRRFGACSQPLYSARAGRMDWLIIVPAGTERAEQAAICHELGHVGGWPMNHSR